MTLRISFDVTLREILSPAPRHSLRSLFIFSELIRKSRFESAVEDDGCRQAFMMAMEAGLRRIDVGSGFEPRKGRPQKGDIARGYGDIVDEDDEGPAANGRVAGEDPGVLRVLVVRRTSCGQTAGAIGGDVANSSWKLTGRSREATHTTGSPTPTRSPLLPSFTAGPL